MFSKSASLYDLIYHFKDYAAESERIASFLRREHPGARTILDVACGTAEHARRLEADFAVDGLDLEPEFVAIAQRKLARGTVFTGDMSAFDLGRRYDAVLCLFSSIGYLFERERLVRALRAFRTHLNPGGVMLLEPWFTPDEWRTGSLHMQTGEGENVKVCRASVSGREGSLSVLQFHYLVATPSGVEHFFEDHRLALRTVEEMLDAFREAGVAVTYDPDGITGRGLYIGRCPPD